MSIKCSLRAQILPCFSLCECVRERERGGGGLGRSHASVNGYMVPNPNIQHPMLLRLEVI